MKRVVCTDFIQRMNHWGHQGKPFLFILDFELKNPIVLPLEEASSAGILYTMNSARNVDQQTKSSEKFTFQKFPVSYEKFKEAYDKVLKEIKLGNSFLTNLTFPTPIKTSLTLSAIFHRSQAPFKLLFGDEFVVFSPESFVNITDGKISSFPMKGTIDAALPNAEEQLLTDPKEIAEHHTIVDMIRNDLSIVATEVKVEKFRFLNQVQTSDKTLIQVSSEITGKLPENYKSKLGTILSKLLPAGSICGAPKRKTLESIKEAETYERGYYTGVFGIFDGQNLESAVMIRYLEKAGQDYIFKSGGGITCYSDPMKEYQELIDKVYVPIH